jgi:hypothetical protein
MNDRSKSTGKVILISLVLLSKEEAMIDVTRVSALGPGPEGNAVCQMLDCERKQQSK